MSITQARLVEVDAFGYLMSAACAYREHEASEDDLVRDAALLLRGTLVSLRIGPFADDLIAAVISHGRGGVPSFLALAREAWRATTPEEEAA